METLKKPLKKGYEVIEIFDLHIELEPTISPL